MIVYPAIDLRGGKVVQLKEGDPNQQTTYNDDPVNTAQQWINQGAEWLHMVNLDGTFSAENDNLVILEQVAQLGTFIQFGGGMRSLADVEHALELGASRVIMGTLAVEQPESVKTAIKQFRAEKICVALDTRDGKIATRGWQYTTALSPIEFGKIMADYGAIHALYTDVRRDGHLQGVNVDDTVRLAQETGLKVIASGGVGDLSDILALAQTQSVAGVIIGTALYEGRVFLKEALSTARNTYAR